MNQFCLLLITIPIITSCKIQKEPLKLKQTYIVEWIGDYPLIDSSHLTIRLSKNNKASGFGGCNNWYGNYILYNEKIKFSNITTTQKYCSPALMYQEKQFINALPTTEHWDFSETKQLRLWPNSGQPIRLWAEDTNEANY